jgi:hypothetical protein
LRLAWLLAFLFFATSAVAQNTCSALNPLAWPGLTSVEFADLQNPAATRQSEQSNTSGSQSQTQPSGEKPAEQTSTPPSQEPERILGIMPNFRAVSAGTIPPPPTLKQAFVLATKNSFDYSSFVFVGITSLMAESSNTHAQLGKGVAGFGKYYWRGFLDKADGNYLVIFAFPTVFHQDERYFALGKGGFWKRMFYSVSRVAITRDYQGHETFNASEVFGRGVAQAISISYYPSQTRTFGGIASKFAYAVGRDALTNAFREFWPDIAAHVLHRNP